MIRKNHPIAEEVEEVEEVETPMTWSNDLVSEKDGEEVETPMTWSVRKMGVVVLLNVRKVGEEIYVV